MKYPDFVKVYRNLHRKCWSVALPDGRVWLHARELKLCSRGWFNTSQECTFVVQPAGRARALKERRRNVHAYVKGPLKIWTEVGTEGHLEMPERARQIYYRLYDGKGFELAAARVKVHGAEEVLFRHDGSLWANGIML